MSPVFDVLFRENGGEVREVHAVAFGTNGQREQVNDGSVALRIPELGVQVVVKPPK